MNGATDAIASLTSLAVYQLRILPEVRGELSNWERRAEAIPKAELRAAAISSLREKRANVEATAVFSILAPHRHRAAALRAMVALQAAIDCIDTLEEQGLEGERLTADPGGYPAELFAACWREAERLPAAEATIPAARRAVERCSEGQRSTHAAARAGDPAILERWVSRAPAPPGYLWWEVAAGASSSVAAHALIAAAANPDTPPEQAALIDGAYFPAIGALTVLLDDLIDREEDRVCGEHNYMPYYESAAVAAERIGLLGARARAAIAPLQGARRHRAILAGIAAFYMSELKPADQYAVPIRERLLQALGPNPRLIMGTLKARKLNWLPSQFSQ